MPQSDVQTERILQHSPTAAVVAERDGGRILFANDRLAALLAWSEPALTTCNLSKLFPDRAEYRKALDCLDGGTPSVELATTLRRADGSPFAATLSCSDVTYRNRPALLIWIAEATPRVSDELKILRAFIENNPASIQMKDQDGRFLMVNSAFERMLQVSASAILGGTVRVLPDPTLVKDVTEHDREVIETKSVITQERRETMQDGSTRYRTVTKFPVYGSDGSLMGIGSIGQDITEQRHAEELLHNAIASMSEGFALFDADERLVLCNENYRQIFPGSADAVVPGVTFEELIRLGTEQRRFPAAYGREEDFIRDRLYRFRNPSGPYEYRQSDNRWIRSEERKTANGGTVSIRTDTTERRRAVESLREREAQLRLMMDSLPVMITYFDSEERFVMINKTGAQWYNRPATMIVGHHPSEILGDGYEKIRRPIRNALQGHRAEFETTITYPDGKTRDVRVIYIPDTDADGRTTGVYALIEDVTLINQTQERLRQSQKMEALGQVTGGVAHEFNNLLMAITGNLELLLENELSDMPKVSEDIRRVLESAFRGKDLTGRLLSYTGNPFSMPERINAGAAALQVVELLRPLLGETVTIDFETQDDLWPIRVDEGEFENAIMNLALNGRDAMPQGGRLEISCRNVVLDETFAASHPNSVRTGDFVHITVRDTGTGMTPEVASRAFDPFYTTKEVGKGTGLGLSMVYGFVHRQSHGYVDIETAEGTGTTVSLYLPRALGEVLEDAAGPTPEAWPVRLPQRSALLVEDNADLRALFVSMLESLNFEALPVDDAAGALDILSTLEPNGRVDLLLTDVVLPGSLNGIELATRALEHHPALKVVLISGYPESDLVEKGLQKNQFPLLSKPFRKTDLMAVLQEVFARGKKEPVL